MKKRREVSFGTIERVGADDTVSGEEGSEDHFLRTASLEGRIEDDGDGQTEEKQKIRCLTLCTTFIVFVLSVFLPCLSIHCLPSSSICLHIFQCTCVCGLHFGCNSFLWTYVYVCVLYL